MTKPRYPKPKAAPDPSVNEKTPLANVAAECLGCRICGSKAAHMTWPILGYFPPEAKILLIGQNPAEPKIAKELEEFRSAWEPNFDKVQPMEYLDWYAGWFRLSQMHRELEPYLGRGWFDTGLFAVTNAVRCRTKKNEPPNEIMTQNCKKYTAALLDRYRFAITMGSLARNQIGINPAPPPKVLAFLEKDLTVLCIAHYAWRPKTGDQNRTKEKQTAMWFVQKVREGGFSEKE